MAPQPQVLLLVLLLDCLYDSTAEALKPGMAWNAWNTFSINGKPIRGEFLPVRAEFVFEYCRENVVCKCSDAWSGLFGASCMACHCYTQVGATSINPLRRS